MKKVILNDIEYTLEKDFKDAFNNEEIQKRMTDYFNDYDYIFGDWSYGQLRLKGFCDKQNKINNKINNIDTLDSYINKYCSFECKYFLLKKVK